MNNFPIRVKLDLTNLKNIEYDCVWIPVKLCSFSKIADLKANICEKYCLKCDEIQLYLRGALLLEDETVLLLRENDKIQVVCKKITLPIQNEETDEGNPRVKRKHRLQSSPKSDIRQDDNDSHCNNDTINGSVEYVSALEGGFEEVRQKKRKKHSKHRSSSDTGTLASDTAINSLCGVSSFEPDIHPTLESCNVPISENQKKKKKHKEKNISSGVKFYPIASADSISGIETVSGNSQSFSQISCISSARNSHDNVRDGKTFNNFTEFLVPKVIGENSHNSTEIQNNSSVASEERITDAIECTPNALGDSINSDTTNCPKKKRRRKRKRRARKPEMLPENLLISEPFVDNVVVHHSDKADSTNNHVRFHVSSDDDSSLNQTNDDLSQELSLCLDRDSRQASLTSPFEEVVSNNKILTANIVQNNSGLDHSAVADSSGAQTFTSELSVRLDLDGKVVAEEMKDIQSQVPERVYSSQIESSQENQGSQINALNFGPKDYDKLPPLKTMPPVGSHIAFKVLELSQSYCPEVSDYKEGYIASIDSWDDTLRIVLLRTEVKRPRTGKFENIFEEPDTEVPVQNMIVKETALKWLELIEPKLVTLPLTS